MFDRQFGVWDGAATSLIAVRYWVATATYAIGDCVVQGNAIWFANGAIPPGPFVPAQWTQLGAAAGVYLPLAGGTMTGAITLAGDAAAALNPASLQQMQAADALLLPKTAGPTQALTGQLYLPAAAPTLPVQATNKAYVDAADTNLQDQIDLLAGNLLFIGVVNATTGAADFTAASGLTDGPLPAAGAGNASMYVIVSVSGAGGVAGLPAQPWVVGDWAVSDGTVWVRIPSGQAAVTAPQVAMNPVIPPLGANVQTSIAYLDTNKVELSGDTMTGPLVLSGPPTVALNPVTLVFLQDYIIDCGVFP